MAHVEALANPALMVWARESASVTQEAVAKRLGVKVEKIRAWETGQELDCSAPKLRNSHQAATSCFLPLDSPANF
jgi:DNA-binding transcriptional regulator YiaG